MVGTTCRVCRGRVHFSAVDFVVEAVAQCHGSRETLVVELCEVEYAPSIDGMFPRLERWLENLFSLDLVPDVRELIQANNRPAGYWSGEPKRRGPVFPWDAADNFC